MLTTLQVEALRGATKKLSLTFDPAKQITIVYGENASGKSSICDSLEFLLKGRVGSVEDRGLGRTESFWHSTGRNASDVKVVLQAKGGSWEARIIKGKVVVDPATGFPRLAILRRKQILSWIAAQPKSRFDAISPFIDISAVEQAEQNLQRLIESEKQRQGDAAARIAENQGAVENFWTQSGKPGKSAIEWARGELQKDTKTTESELVALQSLAKLLDQLAIESNRWRERSAKIVPALAALAEADKRLDEEQAKTSADAAALVRVLEAAQTFFHQHGESEHCPLCESKEFAKGLSSKVGQRLGGIQALQGALREHQNAGRQLDAAKSDAQRQEKELVAVGMAVAKTITSENFPTEPPLPKSLRDAAQALNAAKDSSTSAIADALVKEAAAFSAPLASEIRSRAEKKGFIDTLRRALQTYDAAFQAQKELDLLVPRLEAALKEFQNERRAFVDEILSKIAIRVGELYEAIHPNEGLSKISLLLDPNKRASLEIVGQFPGAKDSPPGAYFSESHLDTLGVCLFLALAELDNATNTLLVLDDIVMSLDEPHVERVIELLYAEASLFLHCILTTHYRPWREKYRWGYLKTGECQFVELLDWEHAGGIKVGHSVPPVEELRGLLLAKPPSTQLVCGSAGVILEALLDFLTWLYECSVPRKKTKPTLGDLLPSVKGKLRAALTSEKRTTAPDGKETYAASPLAPILDELQGIVHARNIFGCHFNELANHLPAQDAIKFGQKVLELADLMIDVNCGWPKSDKSGSYWSNSKQTIRLHPLKQPS